MKKRGTFFLFVFTVLSLQTISAQSYSHIINQQLSETDLSYMPAEELRILKNEIIALKGAQSKTTGTQGPSSFTQYSCTSNFLSQRDQKNIELIERIQREGTPPSCSKEEQYKLFLQMAKAKKQMPIALAQQFYGVSLNEEMSKNQKVFRLSDQVMAFWVPQFSTCKDCPYTNHFVTINQHGEIMSNLKVKGVLTLKENDLLEIKKADAPHNATAQPEYYQITANGKLISKEI